MDAPHSPSFRLSLGVNAATCATLACTSPVDTGHRLSFDECRVTAQILIKDTKHPARAMCWNVTTDEAWATGLGFKLRQQQVRY